MFPRKKIKQPPILNYPHNFQVGDLIKPKYPIQNSNIKDELAIILTLKWVQGHITAELLLQTTGNVQVMTLPRLVLCYEKA